MNALQREVRVQAEEIERLRYVGLRWRPADEHGPMFRDGERLLVAWRDDGECEQYFLCVGRLGLRDW